MNANFKDVQAVKRAAMKQFKIKDSSGFTKSRKWSTFQDILLCDNLNQEKLANPKQIIVQFSSKKE